MASQTTFLEQASKRQFVFIRDAGPEDWRALPRKFVMGEIVQRFSGHTYGLDRDDMMYLGIETIPCTVDGNEGFFTVPVEYLATENGNQPTGNYTRIRAQGHSS